jgi:hypothetical protein
MDNLWSSVLEVSLWLLLGSVARFILPYIIKSLMAVGEENRLGAWLRWEWKYITSIILAMIGYGQQVIFNPEGVAGMLTLSPLTIVMIAYAGQDIAADLVKPARDKIKPILLSLLQTFRP